MDFWWRRARTSRASISPRCFRISTFGTFLVDRGYVAPAQLLQALSHKAQEAFFDCYTWESGELELMPCELPEGVGVSLRLPLGALHRDALARRRDWRSFREAFPNNDATF